MSVRREDDYPPMDAIQQLRSDINTVRSSETALDFDSLSETVIQKHALAELPNP